MSRSIPYCFTVSNVGLNTIQCTIQCTQNVLCHTCGYIYPPLSPQSPCIVRTKKKVFHKSSFYGCNNIYLHYINNHLPGNLLFFSWIVPVDMTLNFFPVESFKTFTFNNVHIFCRLKTIFYANIIMDANGFYPVLIFLV